MVDMYNRLWLPITHENKSHKKKQPKDGWTKFLMSHYPCLQQGMIGSLQRCLGEEFQRIAVINLNKLIVK